MESAYRSDPLELADLLQAAESIALTGAVTSGHILLGTPERLGVADAINSKCRVICGGVPVQLVVVGEAKLASVSLTTVLATPGIVSAAVFTDKLEITYRHVDFSKQLAA